PVVSKGLASSTRLVASRTALADPWKTDKIEALRTLLAAVLEARRRILLEMNVSPERLAEVVGVLPSMKAPTIQELHGGMGYAVKAAVPREGLPGVILRLRRAGATDLIAYALEKVIPGPPPGARGAASREGPSGLPSRRPRWRASGRIPFRPQGGVASCVSTSTRTSWGRHAGWWRGSDRSSRRTSRSTPTRAGRARPSRSVSASVRRS